MQCIGDGQPQFVALARCPQHVQVQFASIGFKVPACRSDPQGPATAVGVGQAGGPARIEFPVGSQRGAERYLLVEAIVRAGVWGASVGPYLATPTGERRS